MVGMASITPTAKVFSRGDQCVSIGQVFIVMGDHATVQPSNLTWGSHHSSSPHFAAPRGPFPRVPAPLWVNHPAAQPPPPNGPNFSGTEAEDDSDSDYGRNTNTPDDTGRDRDGDADGAEQKGGDTSNDANQDSSIIVIHPVKNPVKTMVRTPTGVAVSGVTSRMRNVIKKRSKLTTIKKMALHVKKHHHNAPM